MKMTFNEYYGNVAVMQLHLYRRQNISPADHNDLLLAVGPDPQRIIDYIERNAAANGGTYKPFDLMLGRYL